MAPVVIVCYCGSRWSVTPFNGESLTSIECGCCQREIAKTAVGRIVLTEGCKFEHTAARVLG